MIVTINAKRYQCTIKYKCKRGKMTTNGWMPKYTGGIDLWFHSQPPPPTHQPPTPSRSLILVGWLQQSLSLYPGSPDRQRLSSSPSAYPSVCLSVCLSACLCDCLRAFNAKGEYSSWSWRRLWTGALAFPLVGEKQTHRTNKDKGQTPAFRGKRSRCCLSQWRSRVSSSSSSSSSSSAFVFLWTHPQKQMPCSGSYGESTNKSSKSSSPIFKKRSHKKVKTTPQRPKLLN